MVLHPDWLPPGIHKQNINIYEMAECIKYKNITGKDDFLVVLT